MPITRVGSVANQTTDSTTSPSVTSTIPAGIQAGDFCILCITQNRDTTVVTPPTGWTFLRRVQDTTTAKMDLYTRISDGSGITATTTFSQPTAVAAALISHVVAYRGVDTTNPFIAENGVAEGSTAVSVHSAPALTNTDSGAWGVLNVMMRGVPSPASFTAGAGITELLDTDGGLGTGNNAVAFTGDTNGGVATGSQTFSATSSATTAIGNMWAALLRPAAASSAFSGSLAVTGSGTASFGGSAVGTSGSLAVTGSGSASFGSTAAGASGTLARTGSGSLQLDGALGAKNSLSVSGSAALTLSGQVGALGTLAQNGAGTLTMSGTATQAGIGGTLAVTGSAALSLGQSAASVLGQLARTGSAALSLGQAAASAVGSLAVSGSAALTASGSSLASGSGTLARTGSATLTASGVGTVPVVGSLSATGSAVLTLAAKIGTSGTLARTGSGQLAVGVLGRVMKWTGSTWAPAVVQKWTGSGWVQATVKSWSGSSWT